MANLRRSFAVAQSIGILARMDDDMSFGLVCDICASMIHKCAIVRALATGKKIAYFFSFCIETMLIFL